MHPRHSSEILSPSYPSACRIALYSPYPFMYSLFEKHFRDALPKCHVLPQVPLEKWFTTRLDADVMFLDFSEHSRIVGCVENLRIKYTNASILVKSRSNHPAFRKAVMKAGANCYFSWQQDPRESVEQALLLVRESFQTQKNHAETGFSSRELELLRAIAEGCTETQISRQMNLSVHTVKSYKRQLFKKAGCRNVTGLMRFIYLNGFHQV